MATLRARVELRDSLTHFAPPRAGGRTMERGKPVIMTDPAQIQYYSTQAGFLVTMLEDKKAAAPALPPPPPPPPVDEDLDEDEDFAEEDEGDEVEDEGEPDGEPEDEPEAEPEDPEDDDDVKPEAAEESVHKYTKTELSKLKKPQLAAIADSLGLETDCAKVSELVSGILDAQEEQD